MNITPEQSAFLHQLVPSDALITGCVSIVTWIDIETGRTRWAYEADHDVTFQEMVGVVECVKLEMIDHDRRLGEAF